MQTRARRWCVTVNNYTEDDCNILSNLDVNSIVLGKEVGKCGTNHLQGFIKFKQPMRFSAVKKILMKAHWENAKGSDKQNLDYCSKEHVFIKKGMFSSGGKGGGCSSMILALQVADKNYLDMTI